jgi:hypothetical protein
MLVSDICLVKINAANFKHYTKHFDNIKCGDEIECSIYMLTSNSRARISVRCDLCETEKSLLYKDYKSYGFVLPEYKCRSCNLKRSNLNNWGVENVFQSEIIKQKITQTNYKKWGVSNVSKSEIIKEKKKKTNNNRFGHDWPMQSKEIQEKSQKNILHNWGVDNVSKSEIIKQMKIEKNKDIWNKDFYFQTDDFKEKSTTTNLNKLGVTQSLMSAEIKEKIRETNKKQYGHEIASKNPIIKRKIKESVTKTLNIKTYQTISNLLNIDADNRLFKILCTNCNNEYEIGYSLFYKRRETKTVCCTLCNPVDKHQSGLEVDVYNYIVSLLPDADIVQNFRINNKKFDIYLPHSNLAFEFNGIYWHSELYKNKNYHFSKYQLAKDNNIYLFQIWEDDWLYKNDIVKSMIRYKLGITDAKVSARNTIIKKVEYKEAEKFLKNNHLQGSTKFTIGLGLYREHRLVSLMTFIKRKGYMELNRFCSLTNTIVVGSASKLLKNLLSTYDGLLITFSDNTYSDGQLYEKLGFKKDHDLKPDYYYLIDDIRSHKFNHRKNNQTLIKIWDAGKIRFSMVSKSNNT